MRGRSRERFLADLPAWQAKVASIPARRAAVTEVDPSQRPPLRRRLALLEEHGLAPLHVVLATDEVEDQPYLLAREADLELWAFCDPERYPELYAPEHRFDDDHLDHEGAQLLTRLLARRFADMLDASASSGDREPR